MGVSKNSGFSLQIIHFNRVFHYKPSISGYPYFRKHPCRTVFSNQKKYPPESLPTGDVEATAAAEGAVEAAAE